MKTKLKKVILGLLIIYSPLQTMAWGLIGHRVCGQIAESYLTPKARAAVKAILGSQSIAMASNWADFALSDPEYSSTGKWHYVDMDKVYTYPQMQDYLVHDTKTDAYTRIQFLMADLKKKDLQRDAKLYDLRMLIHLVEDIHQPMHVAHADDKGGNEFKVNWFSNPTNLHALWDSGLINFQQLSYTEYAAAINHTTAAQRAKWQNEPITRWIFESNQLSEKLYTEVRPGDTLKYEYDYTHIDVLNERLLKAGVRLAGVLNKLFG